MSWKAGGQALIGGSLWGGCGWFETTFSPVEEQWWPRVGGGQPAFPWVSWKESQV